jgi:catechol 2,3-dioxygenase-like lactoylglutathione lyase family enzyme
VIDVQRVDYIRVPVTDMEKANHFYGEVLGLERNPNSPDEDWVEYETGNVTLARAWCPSLGCFQRPWIPGCRER